MKKQLLTLSLLLSTTTFSSLSFGEWELVAESITGTENYWDKDRVRVSGGLVYYYVLQNLLKPNSTGDFSTVFYAESSCQRMSIAYLSFSFYKQAMAGGVAETSNPPNPDTTYVEPGTIAYDTLSAVCDYVNSN